VLGVPCLTVMDYPVWLITHKQGTNTLVGSDCARLEKEADKILKSKPESKSKSSVPLWDGQTAGRIIAIISAQN
jgi:UDP-N-acetylglucosamine 2-epimerase (non-hydrolysing)